MNDGNLQLSAIANALNESIEQTGTEGILAAHIGAFRNAFLATAPEDQPWHTQLLFARLPMIKEGHSVKSLGLLETLHAQTADTLSHTDRCKLEMSIAHHRIISCDFDAAWDILNSRAFSGCPFRLLFLGYLHLMKSQQGESPLSMLCAAEKCLLRSLARFETIPAAPGNCGNCFENVSPSYRDTAALYIALAGLWRHRNGSRGHKKSAAPS